MVKLLQTPLVYSRFSSILSCLGSDKHFEKQRTHSDTPEQHTALVDSASFRCGSCTRYKRQVLSD